MALELHGAFQLRYSWSHVAGTGQMDIARYIIEHFGESKLERTSLSGYARFHRGSRCAVVVVVRLLTLLGFPALALFVRPPVQD